MTKKLQSELDRRIARRIERIRIVLSRPGPDPVHPVPATRSPAVGPLVHQPPRPLILRCQAAPARDPGLRAS